MEAEKERRYNQALSQADSLFRLKEYESSRGAYQSALQVKPGEVLPGQRINEIDNLIGQLAAVQQQYEAAVSRGNDAFKQESFAGAKAAFMEAQKAKPEETYPQQMLIQIDSIVETRAQLAAEAEAEKVRLAAEAEAAEQARLATLEAEKERRYNQALSQGDSLFRLKEYESSRTAYQSALQVKPDEALPGQRINEIDNLIGQLVAAQQQYEAAVSRGNEAFKQESFGEAKAAYMEALKAKPEETYPQQMLTQIGSVMEARAQLAAKAEAERVRLAAEAEAAEQAKLAALESEKERRYNEAISQADSLFRLKEYEESRTAYQSALQVKPGEVLPGQRINEIDNLIGQLAAAQQQYDAAVNRGNGALKQELFREAKAAYLEAQKAKPEETYPQQMFTQIDSVMEARAQLAAEAEAEKVRLAAEAKAAEQARLAALEAEREKRYNQAISRADSLFQLKEYEESRTAYQSALQVKPGEVLSGQQIGRAHV